MRLKTSRAAAEDLLIAELNNGYVLLDVLLNERRARRSADPSTLPQQLVEHEGLVNAWGAKVAETLDSVFPTQRERNAFLNAPSRFGAVDGSDYKWNCLLVRFREVLRGLDEIIKSNLDAYTDLPQQMRLFVEDVDSFRKVRDVNPSAVSDALGADGYLDLPEDQIQMALESIINEPFHKKDWGGEQNDLYSANMVVNGRRVPTAFLLKGNGTRARTMEIKHCGHNGDQVVRLFDSPADLFVVQFVGQVSEALIKDVAGKTDQRRSVGKPSHFLIMNGQDTARLLRAYGKL